MPLVRCTNCQAPYPPSGLPYRCPTCNGIFDFDGLPDFDAAKVEKGLPGIWRFRHAFGLFKGAPLVTLGEGNTPLIWDEYNGKRIGLKLESLNPTGAYKDRGSAVLAAQLRARGATEAVEDSSGNAGASWAAYATRAGMKARIFVPESASGPKRTQIEMYGAELVRIPGPRSEAARAVLQEVERGAVYASHAYLPFGLMGNACAAYEIWEELGDAPGSVICPVGHGGLLLGMCRGFAAMALAKITSKMPYLVGAQAAACAPLAAAFENGMPAIEAVSEGPTIAEGVRVRYPVRAEALLNEIGPEQGEFVAIEEELIYTAYQQLAGRGFYIEPTSALAWCALQRLHEKLPGPIVVVLTGNGLKYNPKNQ